MLWKRILSLATIALTVGAIYSFSWLSRVASENYVSPDCYQCMAQSLVNDSIAK